MGAGCFREIKKLWEDLLKDQKWKSIGLGCASQWHSIIIENHAARLGRRKFMPTVILHRTYSTSTSSTSSKGHVTVCMYSTYRNLRTVENFTPLGSRWKSVLPSLRWRLKDGPWIPRHQLLLILGRKWRVSVQHHSNSLDTFIRDHPHCFREGHKTQYCNGSLCNPDCHGMFLLFFALLALPRLPLRNSFLMLLCVWHRPRIFRSIVERLHTPRHDHWNPV